MSRIPFASPLLFGNPMHPTRQCRLGSPHSSRFTHLHTKASTQLFTMTTTTHMRPLGALGNNLPRQSCHTDARTHPHYQLHGDIQRPPHPPPMHHSQRHDAGVFLTRLSGASSFVLLYDWLRGQPPRKYVSAEHCQQDEARPTPHPLPSSATMAVGRFHPLDTNATLEIMPGRVRI